MDSEREKLKLQPRRKRNRKMMQSMLMLKETPFLSMQISKTQLSFTSRLKLKTEKVSRSTGKKSKLKLRSNTPCSR